MPKAKTHRGAAKRFRTTGKGKLAHARAWRSHLLAKKTARRKRDLKGLGVLGTGDARRMRSLLQGR